MFDRFTDRARNVMGHARQAAQRFNHDYIGTEHILIGLINEGSGIGASVLQNLKVNSKAVLASIGELTSHGNSMVTLGKLPFTPRAKRILELSLEEAQSLGHSYIGTEHLLLAVIRENEGIAAQVLRSLNVDIVQARKEVIELLGADEKDDETEFHEILSELGEIRKEFNDRLHELYKRLVNFK